MPDDAAREHIRETAQTLPQGSLLRRELGGRRIRERCSPMGDSADAMVRLKRGVDHHVRHAGFVFTLMGDDLCMTNALTCLDTPAMPHWRIWLTCA